jgi:hypothetical protein
MITPAREPKFPNTDPHFTLPPDGRAFDLQKVFRGFSVH